MWRLVLLIAIVFPILGSSCVRTPPSYAEKILPECTHLDEDMERALASEAFESGQWPDPCWWRDFKDEQLNRLIETSLVHHPDIKLACARIRLASERAAFSRSFLLPYVDSNADLYRMEVGRFASLPPPELDIYTEATVRFLDASYELDIWGKNRKAYFAELGRVYATVVDEREAALLLSTQIAETYFALQVNMARVKNMEEKAEAQDALFDLLNDQFVGGIISEFLLFEVDSERMETLDFLEQLRAEVELNLHQLEALVGNAVGCLDSIGQLQTPPSASIPKRFALPQTLPIDLLGRRPDLVAQNWRIRAAGLDVAVAKTLFYPNINLAGFLGLQSFRLTKFFQAQSFQFYLDSAIHLPIFTGGRLIANLRGAIAEVDILCEEYNQMVLSAVQEVSDALTRVRTTERRRKAVTKGVADATSLYQLTDQRFENGIESYIAVLNAMINLYDQREIELQVALAQDLATVQLIQSLGGGYDQCEACPS